MAARPCHIALTGCPGVDSPITNISAEAPDPLLFWGVPWNPYNPYKPPPLGNGQYVIEDCPGWFTSLIAQFDPVVYAQTQLWANLQALALQLGCDIPQTGDLTFQNDAQTATVYCPDGAAFSYTVDAGTITATFSEAILGEAWVLAANAWALAYAFEQASALMECGTGDPHIPHIPGDDPPDFPRGPGILNNPSWMCFGENYVDNYSITGGSAITGYTMSVIAGAIPSGTVFTQTGPRAANISGVVTSPGQYTWTIQAVSTSLPTITVTFQDSLWVMGISNASSLPDGEVTIPYSESLLGIGGTAPYTFALDVGSIMPGGLSLASNGTISGTPTEDGDFTFDVVITDSGGGECTDTVLLTIVTSSVLCPDMDDMLWATTTSSTGGATAVASPLDTTGSTFDVHVSAPALTGLASAYNAGTINYTGAACRLQIVGTMEMTGGPGDFRTIELKASFFNGSIWSLVTTLFHFDQGNPDIPSTPFSVAYDVPDTGGLSFIIKIEALAQNTGPFPHVPYNYQVTGTITCCSITNSSTLPDGDLTLPYSQQLNVLDLTAPYTFTLTSGALPDGITLSAAGLISGTPTENGSFSFGVTVTDSLGEICTKDFTLDINEGACPNWATLAWGVPTITLVGAGSGAFVPSSAAADNFNANAQAPNGSVDSSLVQNTGTLTFNGGPCACNLHIVVAFIAGLQANLLGTVAIPEIGFSANFNVLGAGTFDLPFIFPDTGGVPLTINATVTLQAPYNGTPAGAHIILMVGTFSNL